MHLLNIGKAFLLLTLVGAEFSVSAFVNPSAWRLEGNAQAAFLSRLAALLGRVMPLWYAVGLLLLGARTYTDRHEEDFHLLVAASVMWLLATLASILFLVPLNNQVIEAGDGWEEAHHLWDARHRIRIGTLAVSSLLYLQASLR